MLFLIMNTKLKKFNDNIILFKCLLQPASSAQASYEAIYIYNINIETFATQLYLNNSYSNILQIIL
jgi:hypothetical protein